MIQRVRNCGFADSGKTQCNSDGAAWRGRDGTGGREPLDLPKSA